MTAILSLLQCVDIHALDTCCWHQKASYNSRVSCQKGPTHHAYAWQIRPFWQDTLKIMDPIKHGLHCSCRIISKLYNKECNGRHVFMQYF